MVKENEQNLHWKNTKFDSMEATVAVTGKECYLKRFDAEMRVDMVGQLNGCFERSLAIRAYERSTNEHVR